jgi:hypothetical protein
MDSNNPNLEKSIERRMYHDFKSFLESIGYREAWQNHQKRRAICNRCVPILQSVGLAVVDKRPVQERSDEEEFRVVCLAYLEVFNGQIKSRLRASVKMNP